MITEMDTEIGKIKIVQIAGSVARRIVSYLSPGEIVEKGERIGIIKLGSRVDIWLPESKVKLAVAVGQKVRAGETTIAELLK
jgi:phosphatidylserine decarboxylase